MKDKKYYFWYCESCDGSFNDYNGLFETAEDAYNSMRKSALSKMCWNTEYNEDLGELIDKNDYIGYDVRFYQDKITHSSYSGTYTYRIKELTYCAFLDWFIELGIEKRISIHNECNRIYNNKRFMVYPKKETLSVEFLEMLYPTYTALFDAMSKGGFRFEENKPYILVEKNNYLYSMDERDLDDYFLNCFGASEIYEHSHLWAIYFCNGHNFETLKKC